MPQSTSPNTSPIMTWKSGWWRVTSWGKMSLIMSLDLLGALVRPFSVKNKTKKTNLNDFAHFCGQCVTEAACDQGAVTLPLPVELIVHADCEEGGACYCTLTCKRSLTVALVLLGFTTCLVLTPKTKSCSSPLNINQSKHIQ